MILSELRRYLQTHRRATLADLSARFDIEPEALEGMLSHWERKGKVSRLSCAPSCETSPVCTSCTAAIREHDTIVYEWRE